MGFRMFHILYNISNNYHIWDIISQMIFWAAPLRDLMVPSEPGSSGEPATSSGRPWFNRGDRNGAMAFIKKGKHQSDFT